MNKNMVKVHKNSALRALGDQARLPLSLSIAFYNNIRLFDLMLPALARQTLQEFEVIISDDGSRPDVVDHIHRAIEKVSFPVRHLWHEDKGFRKNRMLNWAIQQAASDYLVFIDQDCLPHREFLREHLENREDHVALCGRRMELTPWVSKMLTPKRIGHGFIEKNLWWIVPTGAYMHDNHGMKGIYIRNPRLRAFFNQKDKALVGCNFSASKKDLLEVNGFDWRYEAPGTGEDSDIDFRLSLNGVRRKTLINAAVQYHVSHPLTASHSTNENLFAEVRAAKVAKTSFGLREQLLEAGFSPERSL